MKILETEGLTKKYKKFCLDHVSFSVEQGSVMGLIGEYGAGKTTLIKSILGLIRRDEGSVRFFGEETTRLSREDVGAVLSEGNFPDCFTAKEINRTLKKIYKNWQGDVFLNLAEKSFLPMEKSIGELSKENRKKLLLIASIAHQSRLLVLDEIFTDMESSERKRIRELIHDFTEEKGCSVLISACEYKDIEDICDSLTCLHKGKLLFSGKKEILKEQYDRRR